MCLFFFSLFSMMHTSFVLVAAAGGRWDPHAPYCKTARDLAAVVMQLLGVLSLLVTLLQIAQVVMAVILHSPGDLLSPDTESQPTGSSLTLTEWGEGVGVWTRGTIDQVQSVTRKS